MQNGSGGLFVGFTGKQIPAERIQRIIDALTTDEQEGGSVPSLSGDIRDDALFNEITNKRYEGRRIALLNILLQWAQGSSDDKAYRTWRLALRAASAAFYAQESRKSYTEEEREEQAKALQTLLNGIVSTLEAELDERTLPAKKRRALTEDVLSQIRRAASEGTELLRGSGPLGIERRKLYKEGERSWLPGSDAGISYRTYKGGISPKPNSFLLGGKDLPTDYGPLFKELVEQLAIETKDLEKPFGDKEVAQLFLNEFHGQDAFGKFSTRVKLLAHKIIAILLFAELSRHSIALVTAAATFFVVANHQKHLSLVDAFETGNEGMRPLFAGKGGPNLMRGEKVSEMTEEEILNRSARATLDLTAYFDKQKLPDEDISGFIKRLTFHFVFNLSENSSHPAASAFGTVVTTPRLVDLLKRIEKNRSQTRNSVATLQAMGFTYHPQPGDQMDCAIRTVYHQLGLTTGFAGFRDYVRGRIPDAPFGQMIDILTQGNDLLAATQAYLQVLTPEQNPPLIIDVWSATGDGGVMQFQNVAQVNGVGEARYLTFYYNGVNHFDSLTGGPAR